MRKRIEQAFGRGKTIGDLRKLPMIEWEKARARTTRNFAAYDLIRIGAIGARQNPSPT